MHCKSSNLEQNTREYFENKNFKAYSKGFIKFIFENEKILRTAAFND